MLWASYRGPPKAEDLKKVVAKIAKVISRGYLEEGDVVSLTDYFAVAKGLTDIRIVSNGSSSGLNAALWAPISGCPSRRHVCANYRTT